MTRIVCCQFSPNHAKSGTVLHTPVPTGVPKTLSSPRTPHLCEPFTPDSHRLSLSRHHTTSVCDWTRVMAFKQKGTFFFSRVACWHMAEMHKTALDLTWTLTQVPPQLHRHKKTTVLFCLVFLFLALTWPKRSAECCRGGWQPERPCAPIFFIASDHVCELKQ